MDPHPHLAVIGAGPVGLSLALLAARQLPRARITVYDARPLTQDVSADPRALALSLGSVQMLRRLEAWPAEDAQPIESVQVSQALPGALPIWGPSGPHVHLSAREQAVPMLGAVLPYGRLVAPLQARWLAAVAQEPERLGLRFGLAVAALKPLAPGATGGPGIEIDAGVCERADLAVVAEGGVFGEQSRQSLVHDYGQTAWVGRVVLADAPVSTAFEHFTRHGPLALLPIRPRQPLPPGQGEAALVWCVPTHDDPVQALTPAQRLAVLGAAIPPKAGRLLDISPLKAFALGLNAAATLVHGRQVRIGNAAQTLHPVAGQGLNLGLRDAHALVQALRERTDLDAALRHVEWARAPDRWAMIATTDFLARSFTWNLPGARSLSALAMGLLQATPPLKRRLARQMMFGSRG